MAFQGVLTVVQGILKTLTQNRGPVIDDISAYKVYMIHIGCVNPYLAVPYAPVIYLRAG